MSTNVVVVGGSIGGLATAAALAPLVGRVAVVERASADGGSVAPQGRLPHVMCAAGSVVLEGLLPGFAASLLDRGAVAGGSDPERLPVYWHASGAVRRNLILPDRGFPRALCGRSLIEGELRARVAALPNVELIRGVARAGSWNGPRLEGVHLDDGTTLSASLVVDASGRSGALRSCLGLPEPRSTEVGVDLRYTGFVVERRPGDNDGAELVVVQNTPRIPRIGVAIPLDSARWQVLLGGYFGAGAPVDPNGARAFAASLADPMIAPLLDRPFLAEPRRFSFPASRRRHWDRLAQHPSGYLAVGDAVASFNPIYGQGMSSALLQAQALAQVVRTTGLTPGIERRAAARLARVVKDPWVVATGGDFHYPQTTGTRPRGTAAVNRYIETVMRVSAVDDEVNRAFTAVQQLLASPATLFAPATMSRVLRRRNSGRGGA